MKVYIEISPVELNAIIAGLTGLVSILLYKFKNFLVRGIKYTSHRRERLSSGECEAKRNPLYYLKQR
jgi:hypothetical protein